MKISCIKIKNINFILICSIMLMVSACGSQSKSDLIEFVNSAYKDEKPAIEELPPIEPYEEFLYAAQELADPFDAKNVFGRGASRSRSDIELNNNRRKEPLESFDLESIELDGVLDFRGKVSAIFSTLDGETISASVGNYIGRNNGIILSIDSESQVVEIEETVKNATGIFEKKVVTITGQS